MKTQQKVCLIHHPNIQLFKSCWQSRGWKIEAQSRHFVDIKSTVHLLSCKLSKQFTHSDGAKKLKIRVPWIDWVDFCRLKVSGIRSINQG